MRLLFILATLTASTLTGCSADNNGSSDFDPPTVSDIVDEATPSTLKAVTAIRYGDTHKYHPLRLLTNACASGGNDSTACATAANYLGFLQTEVFQQSSNENTAATLYYRYWVDVLDAAMEESKERFADNLPDCLGEDPVGVDFTFNISGADVTVTQQLQCWEEQDAPGETSQNMAFGKSGDDYYLVYRTNDNAETSGSGIRILLAKTDGVSADIWFLGSSYQTSGSTLAHRGNAQRILANKDTGAFTFNTVEEDDTAKSYLFGSFFANTDGSNLYMEAAYGNGTQIVDVTGMTRAAPYCATLSAITTPLAASECESLNASNLSEDFVLTTPMTNSSTGSATIWQADATAEAAFRTAVDAMTDIDYDSKGIGKIPSSL